MNIWILSDCEPLPTAEHPRLMRAGLLFQALIARGHRATWFTSTFDHGNKRYLYNQHTELPIGRTGRLILLHASVAYRKNTSLTRLAYHSQLARRFIMKAESTEEKPDLIFCSWPTMHFADTAVKYGQRLGIPVVVDIRDLWPDIFYRAVPKGLLPIAAVFISPYERMARRAFGNATGVTAIVESHLAWALHKSGRQRTTNDRVFHISHLQTRLSEYERAAQRDAWRDLGVTEDTWNLCFFGTMSAMSFDLEAVIRGFQSLSANRPDMRLILCGDGDALGHYKSLAGANKSIVFPGWCNQSQIQSLLELGKAGLYPMRNLPDFVDSITNKMVGYMAAGLPVLSSLTGYSKTYIDRHQIGLTYQEGDSASFEQAVLKFYQDDPSREKMAQAARLRFLEDFDAEVVNDNLMAYFAELISFDN